MTRQVWLFGNIGGTRFTFSEYFGGTIDVFSEKEYRNHDYSSFTAALQAFLDEVNYGSPPDCACFAVAGPVSYNCVRSTNRESWSIDGDELQFRLRIKHVRLVNDFLAVGYGLLTLDEAKECYVLQAATKQKNAPIACIGAGTGLGECFLTPDIDALTLASHPKMDTHGDSTDILNAVLQKMDIEPDVVKDVVLYAIFDPEAVLQGQSVGVGNYGSITMGGRYDPTAGGGPVPVFGKVVSLTDGCFPTYGPMGNGGIWVNHGLSMLFRCLPQPSPCRSSDSHSGVEVVVISNNGQLLDLAQLSSLGIDITRKKALLVKSKYHYRACLQDIAGRIEEVDGGGLGSRILATGEYRNVRRPIWPLDKFDE